MVAIFFLAFLLAIGSLHFENVWLWLIGLSLSMFGMCVERKRNGI